MFAPYNKILIDVNFVHVNGALDNDTFKIISFFACATNHSDIAISLTVKAATLICISGCGWAISSAKEWISGFIYNFVKS